MAEKNIFRGYVVAPGGAGHKEIEIENNLITRVRDVDPNEATEVYKFGDDILIFPGIVDTHVHARQDVKGLKSYKETFATAVRAAIKGGVVAFMDMPNNDEPPVDKASYKAKKDLLLEQKLRMEIVLYAGIREDTEPFENDIPYKFFLGESVGPKSLFFSDYSKLEESLSRYQGLHTSGHCESPEILSASKNQPTHELRRPAEAEVTAIDKVLTLFAKYDLEGTLCHVSTARGIELAEQAAKSGIKVAIELTQHHQFFDVANKHVSLYPDFIKMNPPVRTPEDREAVLEAIRSSDIEIRWGSDHAPHTYKEKHESNPSGVPTLDTTGHMITWLLEQDIRPERLAKIFFDSGKFFSKFSKNKYGAIMPGYTSAFTLIDTNKPTAVTKEDLGTKCGWSPFEGIRFTGKARVWQT